MITLEDCVFLSGLSEEEVLAIAEHDHLSDIAAVVKGEYLLNEEHGAEQIFSMIVDDIRHAQTKGDKEHVVTLLHVLHHFLRSHPDAAPKVHPWSRVM